jgi:hypothetical protein
MRSQRLPRAAYIDCREKAVFICKHFVPTRTIRAEIIFIVSAKAMRWLITDTIQRRLKRFLGWQARWQRHATGIIGVPATVTTGIIQEAARIAARGFNRIIIREDEDTRGRKRGEVARLLCEAVTKESSDRRCDVVLDEIEAFSQILKEMEKGEVVVIFYDKLEPVLEVLRQHQAVPVSTFEDVQVSSQAVLSKSKC